MSFHPKITILHIFNRSRDHTTKTKFVTRDVTNFSPIHFCFPSFQTFCKRKIKFTSRKSIIYV